MVSNIIAVADFLILHIFIGGSHIFDRDRRFAELPQFVKWLMKFLKTKFKISVTNLILFTSN